MPDLVWKKGICGICPAGCWVEAGCKDGRLVEIAELDGNLHPWMLGVQFHPEFLSRPNRPHPLFRAFLQAIIDHT